MSLADGLRAHGRCGFVAYLTAGDPDLAATGRLAFALEKAGADLLELGVPFSDPVADGPVIQAAAQRALKKKTSLRRVLALAKALRAKGFATPIVLFSYLNPILALGYKKVARLCRASGVQGVLVVDLPVEEAGPWLAALAAEDVEPVLLASPTTTPERLRRLGRATGSILYYASREGVTGARAGLAQGIAARLKAVRRQSGKPLIVGFGVAEPAQAKALAPHAAGVVVGSALVSAAHEGGTKALSRLAGRLVGGLKC